MTSDASPPARPPEPPDEPPASGRDVPGLSWPPPGLEGIQGKAWRVVALAWIGSVILVLPLGWSLAVEQPAWSFGPFGSSWQIGVGLATAGLLVFLAAMATLHSILRAGARAARQGYGRLTILEVATDLRRDMGFLVQGRRHFSRFDTKEREALVRARLRSAGYLLGAALWLAGGFSLSVLLAARGFLTPPGIWLVTLAPAVILVAMAAGIGGSEGIRVDAAKRAWVREAGGEEKVRKEMGEWQDRLDAAGDEVALGAGARGSGRGFRRAAWGVVALFLLVLVPTLTVSISSAVGPILAATAIPTFLSVQEMAGVAEVLRPEVLEPDPSVTPQAAGEALQNLVFVGTARPEPGERPPRTAYDEEWFPDPDRFPDPFSETAARDLLTVPVGERPPAEQEALRQAADHPAHAEFSALARAEVVDVVSTRWTLPFPDTATVFSLPWPRFQAVKTAALAHVARAAVLDAEGRTAEAEEALEEVISVGFVLLDNGPTLVDNLMGVVVVNLGGDALEAFYARTGRSAEAEQMASSRDAARRAAEIARVGIDAVDVHTLLLGIPPLVERSDALRGMRWEYLATFNVLAPCINLHKMVFGPDEEYERWMQRARDRLVRTPGDAALFDLARAGAFGDRSGEPQGGLATLLTVALGSETTPGSCASTIASLERTGSLQ